MMRPAEFRREQDAWEKHGASRTAFNPKLGEIVEEAITSEVRMPDALEVALSIYRPAIALKVYHRFGRSLKHKYYPSKEGGLSRCTT